MAKKTKIKVLLADEEGQRTRGLASFIETYGFETLVVNDGYEAKKAILSWRPKIVVADLMLTDLNALQLLDLIKNEPSLRHQFIHMIVTSAHNNESNVRQAFTRGAKDYIVKPFKHEEFVKRLIFHCRSYRQLRDLSHKEFSEVDEASLMLHLTDLILRQAISKGSARERLYNLTKMVSLKVDGVRCSIVHCLDQKNGVVVTSSDDKDACGIRIDLDKYPEILNVLNTGQMIAIENVDRDYQLRAVKSSLQDYQFNSLIVCPVFVNHDNFGVLSLRMPAEKETVSDNEIRFVEIVAHVVSLVLSAEQKEDRLEFWLKTNDPLNQARLLKFPKK